MDLKCNTPGTATSRIFLSSNFLLYDIALNSQLLLWHILNSIVCFKDLKMFVLPQFQGTYLEVFHSTNLALSWNMEV